MIGKFLNKYPGPLPAPGFDRWLAGTGTYYGYSVSDDGAERHYGYARRDYSTDVLTHEAKQFVQGPSPFFLWLAYNAPHIANRRFDHPRGSGPCRGRMPEPPTRDSYRRFRGVPLPRPASFNEPRVFDKPRQIRSLAPLSRSQRRLTRRRWHCTLATMSRVDEDIHRLLAELRRDGQLSRTIVVYVSDNGFFFGEHRLPMGKGFPYEEALRVPFVARVPRAYRSGPQAPRAGAVVSNQDIAPTLLDYSHASPCVAPGRCRRLDGHSMVPLLGGGGSWPANRGALVEIDAAARSECGCAYEAIRTRRYLYDEWSTGERELYDLTGDPGELRNLAHSPGTAPVRRRLAARLERFRSCSGTLSENAGPRPCE
jgi:arylsulfatase A-like enzyme